MLDAQNEMKKIIEEIKVERNAICKAYADCRSGEMRSMLYDACGSSLYLAVKDIYRVLLSDSDRAALEEMLGSEMEVIELIMNEAEVCVNEIELDEVIVTIERLALLPSLRHVEIKKLI